MIGVKRVLLRGYGNVGNGCIFTRCDPGARVVLMSLVVVMLSMCSPVEFIVYDSHWSSFAVLCLVHFVGSLVWPHRFRHRILHFKYVHRMRQIAEIQRLSAATGAFGYKHSNVLSGLQHSRTHEYDGQPPVDEVDWTLMKAVTPVKNWEQRDSCPSPFMRSRNSCEDQPCVAGDRFVAGFAHQLTADKIVEFEAFNAYAEWCKGQAHDDGHQQEIHLHLSWSTSRRLQLYFTPRQHR